VENPTSSLRHFYITKWAMRIASTSLVDIVTKSSEWIEIECFMSDFIRKVRKGNLMQITSIHYFLYLERPYKCDQCQKSFAQKANYNSHLKTHDTKAYVCKSCHLPHSSAAKLRVHEDTAHPEIRPYRCCHCRKSFKQSHSLDVHKHKCGWENGVKLAEFEIL
jgi:uncharacterized Zn-finger protein